MLKPFKVVAPALPNFHASALLAFIMYKVKIATIIEFQESKDIWNRLALSMYLPSIFCTWEWIYTWWEHFGSYYEPIILFIYKDAVLIGILPLAYNKTKKGVLTGRRLSYCGSIELYPDHLDIICSKEDAIFCLDAVFEFLKLEFKNWDVLDISLVSAGSDILSYLNKKDFCFSTNIRQTSVAPFINLSSSFDDYLNFFDSKKRYNLRKKQRRLYEQGFKYAEYNNISESDNSLRILFELHKQRAEKKSITSTFQGKDIFEFHNIFSQRINKNDCLWLRFINNEKRTIAAFYGFAFGGCLFYYQLGIDPEWENYSPGTVLFYEVINEAFVTGLKEFDFLRGNEEYKNRWTKSHRLLFAVNIYNKTFHGAFLRIIFYLKSLIKKIFHLFG